MFCLLIVADEILGQGVSSVVYKGVAADLRSRPGISVVAVKRAHTDLSVNGKPPLWEEIRINAKVGQHLNIVNLLGVTCQSK